MMLLLAMYAADVVGHLGSLRAASTTLQRLAVAARRIDHVYRWQAAAYLALLLAGIAVTPSPAAWASWWPCRCWRRRSASPRTRTADPVRERRKLSAGVCHTCALLLLLVCMIVAPTTALFRLVMHHELGRLIGPSAPGLRTRRPNGARRRGRRGQRTLRELQKRERAAARQASFTCVPAPFDATGFARDEPEVLGPMSRPRRRVRRRLQSADRNAAPIRRLELAG